MVWEREREGGRRTCQISPESITRYATSTCTDTTHAPPLTCPPTPPPPTVPHSTRAIHVISMPRTIRWVAGVPCWARIKAQWNKTVRCNSSHCARWWREVADARQPAALGGHTVASPQHGICTMSFTSSQVFFLCPDDYMLDMYLVEPWGALSTSHTHVHAPP